MTEDEMNSAFSLLWALAYRVSALPLSPMTLDASARAMRGKEYEDDAAADLLLLKACDAIAAAITGKELHKPPQDIEVPLYAVVSAGHGHTSFAENLDDARSAKTWIESSWDSRGWPEAKIYRLTGVVVE